MSLHSHLERAYQITHRYNPFRAEVGLFPIGSPTPDSPVFVSGNFDTLVTDLRRTLSPFDCWLLICDSAGINVWCAAGVGDFNENKITDALIASHLEEKVRHRTLILSPLAAVGINRRKLKKDTGFTVVWGPTHLDDIPAFIKAGLQRTPEMKLARFTFKDRLEQSIGILGVFSFPLLVFYWWPRQVAWFMLSLSHAIFGTMLGYDRLPPKFPANKTLLLGAAQALLVLAAGLTGRTDRKTTLQRLALGLLAHGLIAIDMIGSTPFYKTTIAHWLTTGTNTSLFQPAITPRCPSCGACLEVCPKGLFERDTDKKVRVNLAKECCECLACVKQCPHHAIINIGTGYKDDIKSLDPDHMPQLRPQKPT
jgi:ferredoxin